MASEKKALVVDDRLESRALVAVDLSEAGFRVVEAENGAEGWQRFRKSEPDLVVTDLRMPGADGIELLRRIRRVSRVPVILLTACGDVPTAVAAIKGGAQEFLTFPDDLDHLIERARELTDGTDTPGAAERIAARIAGRSPAARRLRERLRALAPLRVPVLVSGEPGSGRDHVVRSLLELSTSADAKLVTIAGGGAGGSRRIDGADACYLDEVGRLTLAEQVHWYERLRESDGASSARRFRLFASTSDDLALRARNGTFHEPFAERLLRFQVSLTPLRERPEDIGPLVSQLVERIGREMGRECIRLDRAAVALLRTPAWPGNVRELAAVVEKLVAFSPGGAIGRELVREVLGESADSVASLRSQKSQLQREQLVTLLESCGGNLAEVARRLDISRGAVIYRAQKHGLLPKPS